MIYFIRQGHDGPIKIGYSRNVSERLKSLQTSNPQPLRLLKQWDGEREDEGNLHQKFAHLQISGEWFKPSDELIHYIETKGTAEKFLLLNTRSEYGRCTFNIQNTFKSILHRAKRIEIDYPGYITETQNDFAEVYLFLKRSLPLDEYIPPPHLDGKQNKDGSYIDWGRGWYQGWTAYLCFNGLKTYYVVDRRSGSDAK